MRKLKEEGSASLKEVLDDDESVRLQRSNRRKKQKAKKMEGKKVYPTLGQIIIFKEYNSDEIIKAKVFRVHKKSSIHRNFKQLELFDGSKVEKV